MKAYYKPRKSILKFKESIIVAQQRREFGRGLLRTLKLWQNYPNHFGKDVLWS